MNILVLISRKQNFKINYKLIKNGSNIQIKFLEIKNEKMNEK